MVLVIINNNIQDFRNTYKCPVYHVYIIVIILRTICQGRSVLLSLYSSSSRELKPQNGLPKDIF